MWFIKITETFTHYEYITFHCNNENTITLQCEQSIWSPVFFFKLRITYDNFRNEDGGWDHCAWSHDQQNNFPRIENTKSEARFLQANADGPVQGPERHPTMYAPQFQQSPYPWRAIARVRWSRSPPAVWAAPLLQSKHNSGQGETLILRLIDNIGFRGYSRSFEEILAPFDARFASQP